jgi:hypothetical protein
LADGTKIEVSKEEEASDAASPEESKKEP